MVQVADCEPGILALFIAVMFWRTGDGRDRKSAMRLEVRRLCVECGLVGA